ncbi:MAG: hypothetical protein ABJB47_22105, partial [Actinomycetota bacterium]
QAAQHQAAQHQAAQHQAAQHQAAKHQAGHRTVLTGTLIRVGGPAPGAAVPLPGQVTAVGSAGSRFVATAGAGGRYRLELPPGTYRLTGRSPLVQADGSALPCAAGHAVRIGAAPAAAGPDVVCSVR